MSLVYAIADPHGAQHSAVVAQARRTEPLAIAIPRAPECPIKVLTLPGRRSQ